jgi:hypothetical protein
MRWQVSLNRYPGEGPGSRFIECEPYELDSGFRRNSGEGGMSGGRQ